MNPPEQTSEQLNNAILVWTHELAPHGIFTTDKELRITSWNHWLERHSSMRAEQVVGRPLIDIIPSLAERRLVEYFNDALRGEVRVLSRALHGYLLPMPSSGSDTTFDRMQQSARIAPLLLEGQVCGTITIVEDVTERECQNSILRESEERFRVMADTVPNIIYTAASNGQVDFINQRFYDVSGLPPRSGLGSGWLQVIHPDDAERAIIALEQSIKNGNVFAMEFRIKDKAGQFRWFISRAWPIRDADNRVVKWFGAATDIHDLKVTQLALASVQAQLESHAGRLEDTVAERTAKLRETIRHLESFSYTVAHDLRAPIRAMQGYANILLEDLAENLDEKSTTILKNISRAAKHLDALTRDVLNYTRVSTQEVQLQSVNVEELVHNVTAMNPALQAPHSNIGIVRPLHRVMAHPTLLAQSISNLLDNAVKFVAPDVMPRIVVRSELCGDAVRLWIEDN
ncbi:MAG TPA: PAS domain S-box protein, partial [Candidatus Binatia bacterium]|nr:PAS domain S-box protein [Candidatus Binatia bacterium]